MAVGATFQDSQGTDLIGQQQSYMQRAQAMRANEQTMRLREEEAQQEKAKFAAFLPAIIAKREADIASAKAAVTNTTRMEQLRSKAATSSEDYNDRFLNIMSIPDFRDRSDTLAAFQAEVSWMDVLPEYKGFVDSVNNARAQSFTSAITNMKLDQALEAQRAAIEGRVAVAEVGAGARTANAQTRASSQERIAAINADTKLSVADKQAQRTSIGLENLMSKVTEADQLAADASAAGNEQEAQAHRVAAAHYRDALTKSTTFAGASPSTPKTKSQDVRPSPPLPADVNPPLTLGGKSLAGDDGGPKLYVVDPKTRTPTFAPSVKTPQQVLGAVQQMVDDGAVTPEEARATLTRLGFKPKK